MNTTERLRTLVIRDARKRFGVDLHPHPTNERIITVGRSEHEHLERSVLAAPDLNAIGRGYYLGNFDFLVAPDWTLNQLQVAHARLIATIIVTLHLRQIIASLTQTLGKRP